MTLEDVAKLAPFVDSDAYDACFTGSKKNKKPDKALETASELGVIKRVTRCSRS